jgi:hypothetical protein
MGGWVGGFLFLVIFTINKKMFSGFLLLVKKIYGYKGRQSVVYST